MTRFTKGSEYLSRPIGIPQTLLFIARLLFSFDLAHRRIMRGTSIVVLLVVVGVTIQRPL